MVDDDGYEENDEDDDIDYNYKAFSCIYMDE